MSNEKRSKKPIVSDHHISVDEEERIMAYVEDLLKERPDMTDEDKEVLQYKQSRYRAFQMRNAIYRTRRSQNPEKMYTKRLSWEMLAELKEIFGFSYMDILKVACTKDEEHPFELKWSTETQARMCSFCDRYLSKAGREKLLSFLISITSPRFRDRVEEKDAPIWKLFSFTSWSETRLGETRDKMREIGMEDRYQARLYSAQSALTFEQIVFLTYTFKVSAHWMLSAGEDELFLAQNGTTESIMDYFCLFPEDIQQCILSGLELHFGIGGIN